MIIAIDFDGTIFEAEWPEVGSIRLNAKRIINRLFKEGHTIIINTCRSGRAEELAILALNKNDIDYHHINENCPIRQAEYQGEDCRKISADVYIDDKCVGGLPTWNQIYSIIDKLENPENYKTSGKRKMNKL